MWIEIAGWGGMVLMLLAYYLASHEYLNENRYSYHMLNFFGALGVMMNAFSKGVLAVGFVEVSWSCISIVGLYNVLKHQRRAT